MSDRIVNHVEITFVINVKKIIKPALNVKQLIISDLIRKQIGV